MRKSFDEQNTGTFPSALPEPAEKIAAAPHLSLLPA